MEKLVGKESLQVIKRGLKHHTDVKRGTNTTSTEWNSLNGYTIHLLERVSFLSTGNMCLKAWLCYPITPF